MDGGMGVWIVHVLDIQDIYLTTLAKHNNRHMQKPISIRRRSTQLRQVRGHGRRGTV